MGKTIFAAVVAAILASIATTLVMNSFQAEERAAARAERTQADETGRVERERLERRLGELERRTAAQVRTSRRSDDSAGPAATGSSQEGAGATPPAPGAAGENGGEPQRPLAPDGTPYISRAELEAYVSKSAEAASDPAGKVVAVKPVPKKTLAEIAADMGLSAAEEAALLNILRESEEEFVRGLFGDRPLADVKRDVLEAKDDPEKQSALMQGIVQQGIQNVGRLMTLESRMKKRVESVLGKDRTAKFLGTPRKPVIDADFEDVLKDF